MKDSILLVALLLQITFRIPHRAVLDHISKFDHCGENPGALSNVIVDQNTKKRDAETPSPNCVKLPGRRRVTVSAKIV